MNIKFVPDYSQKRYKSVVVNSEKEISGGLKTY